MVYRKPLIATRVIREGPSRLARAPTSESATSESESVLIKGAVTNGGAFIATLGPKSLNIFLQGARQVWRYSGAQFSGELAPLRRANLENDVRIRTPVQLESVDD